MMIRSRWCKAQEAVEQEGKEEQFSHWRRYGGLARGLGKIKAFHMSRYNVTGLEVNQLYLHCIYLGLISRVLAGPKKHATYP